MNDRNTIIDEIEQLRRELSVTIPQEMQMAVESGDLRENSEYSSVVAKQHFVNVRLKQLLDRLQQHRSIDLNSISRDSVGIGSMIKVRHLETNKIQYFKMVMTDSAGIDNDRWDDVTIQSPIGKALHNRKEKEQVSVPLPIGRATFKILKVYTIHDSFPK